MSATSAAFVAPVARASSRSTRRHRVHAPIARAVAPSLSSSSVSDDALPTFPGGWLGPDLAADPGSWTHRLTDDEIAELDAALASAETAGLDVIDLTPDTFPLPTLATRLDGLRRELVHGRGLHLFRGVPVHRYTPWQRCAVFYGMGAHMGWTCPQNARGHVLGHVKDLGADPNDPTVRIYTTCAAQPFHTDSADIVGLMCLENSASGGESKVVSSVAVWNRLARTAPDLARTLLEPFPVDRKGEVPPGKSKTYDMPVFHRHGVVAREVDGSAVSLGCVGAAGEAGDSDSEGGGGGDGERGRELLSGIYDRNFIDAAQARFTEDDGVPRLTPTQIAALDALDATCDDPGLRLDMRLEPGDVQWLHNHTTFHARRAYSDGDGKGPSRRHLLRLWITPPDARALPGAFAERFGDLRVGAGRGGIRVEGQTPFCALEPGA